MKKNMLAIIVEVANNKNKVDISHTVWRTWMEKSRVRGVLAVSCNALLTKTDTLSLTKDKKKLFFCFSFQELKKAQKYSTCSIVSLVSVMFGKKRKNPRTPI